LSGTAIPGNAQPKPELSGFSQNWKYEAETFLDTVVLG
jgi:hypothetical protein